MIGKVKAGLRAALLGLAAALTLAATANDPADRLADPAQEARARAVFAQVRCLVCQNESIADTEADLAADLRRIVRSQIQAGQSDQQIKDFLLMRYGQFVLLQPQFSAGNLVLWSLPFVVVLAGGVLLIWRRRRTVEAQPLTLQEIIQLEALKLEDHPQRPSAHDTKVT